MNHRVTHFIIGSIARFFGMVLAVFSVLHWGLTLPGFTGIMGGVICALIGMYFEIKASEVSG